MHRFFVEPKNISEHAISIEGEDVKHIKNVLRLEEGDEITLCDGNKQDYLAVIQNIENKTITCDIRERYESRGEAPIDIVLYQGLPKSAKMDLIIQKMTELGVHSVVPVMTERCVVKIKDRKKEEKKIERWQKIAREAAKQSKRGRIPTVEPIHTFEDMLKRLSNEEHILVPYEGERQVSIKETLKAMTPSKVHIIIGPEGGFDASEIEKLQEINAKIVTLGPRILRTETAGFTTIAVVMYELGDLGVK